jgi:hypothetical protein
LDGTLESANTLARLAYLQVAAACPGNPTQAERARIKEDSTHPSDDDIDMRSLSPSGVKMIAFLCVRLLNEMVAQSAPAYAADDEAYDESLPVTVFAGLQQQIENGCKEGLRNGITPYGVASTAMIHIMDFAMRHNVQPLKLTRPLKHCLELTYTGDSGQQKPVSKDAALEELAAMLGVTKATAKKYLRRTKR